MLDIGPLAEGDLEEIAVGEPIVDSRWITVDNGFGIDDFDMRLL